MDRSRFRATVPNFIPHRHTRRPCEGLVPDYDLEGAGCQSVYAMVLTGLSCMSTDTWQASASHGVPSPLGPLHKGLRPVPPTVKSPVQYLSRDLCVHQCSSRLPALSPGLGTPVVWSRLLALDRNVCGSRPGTSRPQRFRGAAL